MIETLPRRERDVFEALCRLEQATAASVRAALADPLSDSAVRTLLSRLEAKGLVRRQLEGPANLYTPVPSTDTVATGALTRLIDTFFNGSAAGAATALLGMTRSLKPDELAALERAIDEAKGRGR